MTITYISGGLLGDFIHQLSVINEIFIKTNKKGILYIANIGDKFKNGLNQTFDDLYEIIILQDYISDFRIYNNEQYDIDLSKWRHSPTLFIAKINKTLSDTYNIDWGKHKWLNNVPNLEKWHNKIIINTVHYRFPSLPFFEKLKDKNLSDYIYVSVVKSEYEYFTNATGINIDYYSPQSLMELCIILNSCKSCIGSLSAPLSIATAFHQNCVYGIDYNFPVNFSNMHHELPFIKYEI
jgi:hypothetical protein